MGNNILLIVAAGKSSRFGGFPKAFCKLGNITNAENTVMKSRGAIDKVYIGVNNKIFDQFKGSIKGCELFAIKTGQGDAHSLLKCLKYVKSKEENMNGIMVCWGDAVFVSSKPFEEMLLNATQEVNVACSSDEKPYAWFDVDDKGQIVKSHFAKEEGFVPRGIHDQSLFYFDVDFAIRYLDTYRESLGIPEENDEETSHIDEMKLLYSFEYLKENGHFAQCIEVTEDQVLSFNTQEELEVIEHKLGL